MIGRIPKTRPVKYVFYVNSSEEAMRKEAVYKEIRRIVAKNDATFDCCTIESAFEREYIGDKIEICFKTNESFFDAFVRDDLFAWVKMVSP